MRRSQRLEAIGKANELLYEQTDKMKMLRSQQLYAEVIHERVHQIGGKQEAKDKIREANQLHHQEILRQIKVGEEAERVKLEEQRRKMEDVKIARAQQRDEVRNIKEEAVRKVKEAGLNMKRESQLRVEEELKEQELKKTLAAESNLRMLRANEELKSIRLQLKDQDRIADEERNAEILKIDARKQSLKDLEKVRFEKKQETRQKIIDAAVKKLAETANTEQLVLAQQMQDLQDKEDRLLAEKKARNEKFREDVSASRISQIERREREQQARMDEEVMLVAKFREENESGIRTEAEKIARAKAETNRIKKMQYDDGQAAIRRKQEEKLLEIEQARFLTSIQGNDDDRFVELCKQEIERNAKAGKPVYTLLRALQQDQPHLLPAKRVEGNGRKKDKE